MSPTRLVGTAELNALEGVSRDADPATPDAVFLLALSLSQDSVYLCSWHKEWSGSNPLILTSSHIALTSDLFSPLRLCCFGSVTELFPTDWIETHFIRNQKAAL